MRADRLDIVDDPAAIQLEVGDTARGHGNVYTGQAGVARAGGWIADARGRYDEVSTTIERLATGDLR